jgi:hypothetical protein
MAGLEIDVQGQRFGKLLNPESFGGWDGCCWRLEPNPKAVMRLAAFTAVQSAAGGMLPALGRFHRNGRKTWGGGKPMDMRQDIQTCDRGLLRNVD